jgi:hypothetical protein
MQTETRLPNLSVTLGEGERGLIADAENKANSCSFARCSGARNC